MAYKVLITDFAWGQLKNITDYVVYELLNSDAAESILEDFDEVFIERVYHELQDYQNLES